MTDHNHSRPYADGSTRTREKTSLYVPHLEREVDVKIISEGNYLRGMKHGWQRNVILQDDKDHYPFEEIFSLYDHGQLMITHGYDIYKTEFSCIFNNNKKKHGEWTEKRPYPARGYGSYTLTKTLFDQDDVVQIRQLDYVRNKLRSESVQVPEEMEAQSFWDEKGNLIKDRINIYEDGQGNPGTHEEQVYKDGVLVSRKGMNAGGWQYEEEIDSEGNFKGLFHVMALKMVQDHGFTSHVMYKGAVPSLNGKANGLCHRAASNGSHESVLYYKDNVPSLSKTIHAKLDLMKLQAGDFLKRVFAGDERSVYERMYDRREILSKRFY